MATVDSLAELVRLALDARLLDVHTALPGKVLSYDAATNTAEIELTVTRPARNDDGELVRLKPPTLPNVPIAFPRGGGFSITWPINAGDHVLLIFSEADVAQWREAGEQSHSENLRRHSLGSAFALPCIAPNSSALAHASESALCVVGSEVRLGTSAANADFVALAAKVNKQFEDLKDKFNEWAPVAQDGGQALKTKLTELITGGWPENVSATKVKAE